MKNMHLQKSFLSFVAPFCERCASNFARCANNSQKFYIILKNVKFDADIEFVENKCKKFQQKRNFVLFAV